MKRQHKLKFIAFKALSLLSDDIYLQIRYRQRVGFWPNIKEPRRFSEKLQWLKVNDRQRLMTDLADKLKLKQIVNQRYGPDYSIPILASGKKVGDLSVRDLPSAPFMLKTNHDSGGTQVIEEPAKVNVEALKKWLRLRLSASLYAANREWEYKNIAPQWFIEPLYADDKANNQLNDFKFHCFHGEPRFVQTIFDRGRNVRENWFDIDWKPIDISYFSRSRALVEAPVCLDQMAILARDISAPFPYARVDFYVRQDRPLIGEVTFRPYGGFMKWDPDDADFLLGDLLHIAR